jgi:hypothetical protein
MGHDPAARALAATPVSHASGTRLMLHCNMTSTRNLQLGLEDLLADLRHARRHDDLGRLALVAYCEVRRWARDAGALVLAEHASELFTGSPYASREAFLGRIDNLIHELEEVLALAPSPGSEMRPFQLETRKRSK